METAGSSSSDRPRPPTAKWGAACSTCATAKAKCIRSNPDETAKCDRCQRLFKECTAQVHRPRKKRQSKPSRTAQIEERLNGLVNLLQTEETAKSDVDTDKLGQLLRTMGKPRQQQQGSSSGKSKDTGENPWFVPEEYNCHAPPSCLCRADGSDAPPPPDSDDAFLEFYRTELLPAHPFVVIPPNMSAATLRTTRPFLMSAIRMVASFKSFRSMRAQMYHLMKHITDHMMVQSERSMDLLLGIIVIVGYYQYHCFLHAQMGNLVSLAVSLVGELGLIGPPTRAERTILMAVKPLNAPPRTNEEKRALAGVWFLSSSLSLSFNKIEPMRFTRYMNQCVQEVEDSMEYETDTMLVNLVRIQHLIVRISRCTSQGKISEEMPTFAAPYVPKDVFGPAFQAELDQFRANLPPSLKGDKIFQAYIDTAVLRLYEPPQTDSDLLNSLSDLLDPSLDGSDALLHEFYRSHDALVSWFDNWLSVPVESYYCQTVSTCSLLVYAISLLGRWAKILAPSDLYKTRDPPSTSASPASPHQYDMYHLTPDSLAGSTAGPGSSVPTPAAASDASADKEPCQYTLHNPQLRSDPSLPAAVASLRARLRQQPGLHIDITAILETLQTRFQHVSSWIQGSCLETESDDQNAWTMGAIKVLITRAKLERWADLVAAGTEALSLEDRVTQDAIMGDVGGNPLQDGFLEGSEGMTIPDLTDSLGPEWMMNMMSETQQQQQQPPGWSESGWHWNFQ